MLNYAELRKLLAQDKLAKLVETLHAATVRADADLNNQVVAIAGRLTRVNAQLNTGQISHEEANQERSRISAALLDIINQLEANYPNTQQQAHYQQQMRPKQAAAQPQQSRAVWPYILLGVVGCIVVLAIVGNMMGSGESAQPTGLDVGTVAEKNTLPSTQTGSSPARKLTDERPATPTSESRPAAYSADDMVGTWRTLIASEGMQVVAFARFNADGTCHLEAYINQVLLNAEEGTWRLSGNTLYQSTPGGGADHSTIRWINRNQFQATNEDEGITIIVYDRVQ